jgi:hypothetical protein
MREEQYSRDCIISKDGTERKVMTYQGANTKTKTRVLFCRETYDFPAERLLHPFCELPDNDQNATVLVNHMGKYIGHHNIPPMIVVSLKFLSIIMDLSMICTFIAAYVYVQYAVIMNFLYKGIF